MILPGFPTTFSHNGYDFAAVAPAGVAQIRAWLKEPHIADWWTPDADTVAAIQAGQTADKGVLCFIVSHGGRPFGYVQCYDAAADAEFWGDAPQAAGTYGFNQFIGDAEMIGFGHGINFIKAFVTELKNHADVKRIVVTPAPDNTPAVRSYTQAGFRKEKVITTANGPTLLMAIQK